MSNLKEMKEMADNAIVNEFIGTVTYVNDPVVHAQYGPSQRVTMQDEAGESVSLTLSKAHANFTIEHKGQKFIMQSKPTAAHGMQGVKISRNGEYTNLKITDSAKMTAFDGGAAPAPIAQAPAQASVNTSVLAQTPTMDHEELAAKMVAFTVQLKLELNATDVPDHIKDAMVIKAPEYAALWWFGQKDLNWKPRSKTQEADQNPSAPDPIKDDVPW